MTSSGTPRPRRPAGTGTEGSMAPARSQPPAGAGRNHLYGSALKRLPWLLRRFGWRRMLAKPVHLIAAPLVTALARPARFPFRGESLELFYHRYNTTWVNERAIEIPIARRFLEGRTGRTLEIGNVMGHYGPAGWDVVDRFERGGRVINCDALSFQPEAPYKTVLSISTIEHIGHDDEDPDSEDRILATLARLRDACLAPSGRLLVTAPLGYNPALDGLVFGERLGFDEQVFMKRVGRRTWREVPVGEAAGAKYNTPFPYGNCVLFGYVRKPGEDRHSLR